MNTIYIQIDSNSLPKECGEDFEVLDCRCINDFCSLVGDVLVGDLKDENNKPYYRLITPVGRLLMDFKDYDEKTFNAIIEMWYDVLGNLLHNGALDVNQTVIFPQQYIDWLISNENLYFEQVGKELLKNNGTITLSPDDIVDDIITSLSYKISYFLKDKNKSRSFVVFSNPLIQNSSFIIKRVKYDGIKFLRYDSWKKHIIKKWEKDGVLPEIVLTVKGISFKMIHVEGGEFTMGATSEQEVDAFDDEKPQHRVTVSSYYIGETEVTQSLWQTVMGCNPSKFKGANRPVEQVSWDDCQLFISKLDSLTGKKFRLPTYEEWKYASLGGKKSQSYRYYGSNSLDTVAWYEKNSGKETHPVRTKTPNELGLYDMNGNVWEWCLDMYEDIYERYKSSSRPSPVDASSGYHRLLGGSCLSNSERCLSSLLIHESDRSFIDTGLRLVLCSNCQNVIDKNNLLNKVSTRDRSESTESSVASIDDMDYRDNGWPIDGDWPWYCPRVLS